MKKKKRKRVGQKKGRFKLGSFLGGVYQKKLMSNRLDKVNELNKMISPEFTDRVVDNAGMVENYGDFKYEDGTLVPIGESYHIHYSKIGKKEIYMTGKSHDATSLVIERLKGNTVFGQYVKQKKPNKGETYLGTHKFEVTNKHQKMGKTYRYFAKQSNNSRAPIFEISKSDFSKISPFYKKIKMKWSLSLSKELMRKKNIDEIENAVDKGFGSLEFSLNPDEGFFGEQGAAKQDTLDKVGYLMGESNTKKKKKRKKQSKKKRVQSTTTTTQTAPSSGGGAY